jgi:hypothetical protein
MFHSPSEIPSGRCGSRCGSRCGRDDRGSYSGMRGNSLCYVHCIRAYCTCVIFSVPVGRCIRLHYFEPRGPDWAPHFRRMLRPPRGSLYNCRNSIGGWRGVHRLTCGKAVVVYTSSRRICVPREHRGQSKPVLKIKRYPKQIVVVIWIINQLFFERVRELQARIPYPNKILTTIRWT